MGLIDEFVGDIVLVNIAHILHCFATNPLSCNDLHISKPDILIKQHQRIKRFYGTSENAVKNQLWIAVSVYVLVAIMKKRLNLQESLYIILQILSVSIFEKIPLYQLVTDRDCKSTMDSICNQLKLF